MGADQGAEAEGHRLLWTVFSEMPWSRWQVSVAWESHSFSGSESTSLPAQWGRLTLILPNLGGQVTGPCIHPPGPKVGSQEFTLMGFLSVSSVEWRL